MDAELGGKRRMSTLFHPEPVGTRPSERIPSLLLG